MARPKLKEPKTQYTVMLKPSVVKEIDRIAKKLDVSRSQMMANLVEMGLEDAELLDKSGLLYLANLGRKALSHLKKNRLGKDGNGEEEVT